MGKAEVKGVNENKCFAVLINGSPDLDDAEVEHSWAAFHLKEQGCTVYAATTDKPKYADNYYKPDAKGIAQMFGQLSKATDEKSDVHLYINTHGLADSIKILGGNLSKATLEGYIEKMDFAKMAVMMGSCYSGIWQSVFASDPRILFMSQGSPGEVVYGGEFPIWSEWEDLLDQNGDSLVSYSEAFTHFSPDVDSSKPIFIGGWAYDDIGIQNANKLSQPFKDEVVKIKTPDELEDNLSKLGEGEYAFVQCATGEEKSRKEDKKLFKQQALASHGRFGFFSVESDDLTAYPECNGGGTKMFGQFLPEGGLQISKKHKFALWEIPDVLADAKRQAMRQAIQDSDWKGVSALLGDCSYTVFCDDLVDIVMGMAAGHQIPSWVLSKAVMSTYTIAEMEKAFRHLIARKDVDEKEILKVLEGSDGFKQEAREELLTSILDVREDLSADLLLEIIWRTQLRDTTSEAFARLLALPFADEAIAKVLETAQDEGWNVYNELVDAVCGAGKADLCKSFEKVAKEDGSGDDCGCVTAQSTMTSVQVYNGSITLVIKGDCTGDAAVNALLEKKTQGLCAVGQWVEKSSNADARKCIDGGFQAELKGYCN